MKNKHAEHSKISEAKFRELAQYFPASLTATQVADYLTEIDTDKIDANFMNSRFQKYLRALQRGEPVEQALNDLHKTFATLTQEEQKYAAIFLHDIERGDAAVEEGKTLRDYITEYQVKAKDDQIRHMADIFGMCESTLREMVSLTLTEANINEYGRFVRLKSTVDKKKAREYFEKLEGAPVPPFRVNILLDATLRKFLLAGG